jgi:signal transduction histidine kinase
MSGAQATLRVDPPRPAPRPRPRLRGLLWRIYVINIGGLALISVAFGILKTTVLDAPWRRTMGQRARYIISHVARYRDDPPAMRREAAQARQDMMAVLSLYDPAGNLLVSNIDPPLPRLAESENPRLSLEGLFTYRTPGRAVVPVTEGDRVVAYGVIVLPKFPVPFTEYATLVSAVLLCLAAASLLLTRMMVRPLRKLAAAAQAFGDGDLGARVRLTQRDELGAVARTFDEMADRITLLLRRHKELLANVSHELRTPIASIRVALELLTEGEDAGEGADKGGDGSRAELLRGVTCDLGELEQLVEDILITARLDLAQGRAGDSTPPLRLASVTSAQLIEQAAGRFAAAYPRHQLQVDLDLGGSACELRADRTLLRRALDNILDNAGKYSDPGSLVRVQARVQGHRLHIEVTDQGIGIAVADQPNLFTPFFRSDRSRARSTGGVGLGLMLSRRIVEAHGGTLDLTSNLAAGTTARFVLPCAPPAAKGRVASEPPSSGRGAAEEAA